MSPRHLSDDQLLDRIYGIGPADVHFEDCPACQARWQRMQQLRAESVRPLPGAAFFHRQRRSVLARIDQPRRYGWVPATAAAACIVGLVLTSTAPRPVGSEPKEEASIIEAGWFEDTYSATRVLEPTAASPLRELFVEGPVVE